jgi:hypothetical protein
MVIPFPNESEPEPEYMTLLREAQEMVANLKPVPEVVPRVTAPPVEEPNFGRRLKKLESACALDDDPRIRNIGRLCGFAAILFE